MAYSVANDARAFSELQAHVGDEAVDAAFARLYEEHFRRVYAFVRSQVGSVADAQDLVGRIFVKAYTHWRRAPAGDAAVLWLYRIAKTTVIDYGRVERRRESSRVSVDELERVHAAGDNPEAEYMAREREASLLFAMSLLDDENRTLLNLKFTAQRTNREIAGILRISEAAVSMRLLRALRRLREQLRLMGVS